MRVTRAIALSIEEQAWEMRQQGLRQSTIAQRLGRAESSISEALARIERRVLAEMNEAAAQQKALVTAQLWTNYEELRSLYDASKGPKRKQRRRRAGGLLTEGRPDGNEGGIDVVESQVEERIGDVAIFREMRATLDMILKIWGGYAPTKIAPTNPAGDQPYDPEANALSDDERTRRIRALLTQFTDGVVTGTAAIEIVDSPTTREELAKAPVTRRRRGQPAVTQVAGESSAPQGQGKRAKRR